MAPKVSAPAFNRRRPERGAVLLEVVLALALFVAVATVIAAALNSSLDGVERQKLNLHAANLAASVMAELEMGIRSPESTGPEPFAAPFEHWTWQLVFTASDDDTRERSGLARAEVIVRHEGPPIVHRLAQMIRLDKSTPDLAASSGGAF